MTEAKYVGNFSPILNENWTDNTPSYYSYYDSHMKRKAARKKLRRERLVLFTTMLLIISLMMMLLAIRPEGSSTYEGNLLHCVEHGESLWSIANEYKAENEATGEFVYEIKKINSMKTSAINVGDLLIIPE